MKESSEKYIRTLDFIDTYEFYDLGLTDSLLLEVSKKCELLVTCDSRLSDYAIENGIEVFDLVQLRNARL